MCLISETLDWKLAHDKLVSLAKRRAAHELEEGRWLLAGLRHEVHKHLGMGSYAEYLHRLFGYEAREVGERLRVARALEQLPDTAAALGSGALCFSAVRELTRVASPETEAAWLQAGSGKTVRQIEKMVSGRQPGDRPSDPADESARRHLLRFDVSAETYALWREAVAELRREAGGNLDEDDALLMMARLVLGGPNDEGRASYQVAMTVCEGCGQGWQDGRGEPVAVDDVVVEMAECDAQHVGHVDTHVGKRASQTIPPATRRAVLRRDHHQCVVDGCRLSTFVDVHHLDPRADGGSHEPARLVTLCGAHHRAVHRGLLIIEGSAEQLAFLHADGSRYGSVRVDAGGVEVRGQAFSALRHLGFKETPSQRALDAAVTHVGIGAGVQELVRAALAVLTYHLRRC